MGIFTQNRFLIKAILVFGVTLKKNTVERRYMTFSLNVFNTNILIFYTPDSK